MSSKTIIDSIRNMAKPMHDGYGIFCKVSEVDVVALTCYCVPINGNPDIINVKLMANANNGFLIVPKDDSIVVVSFTSDATAFVSMFSEVDEIQLNGKNYDGLVKINDLVTKLNNLENKVNTIITTFNAHTHAGVTSGVSSTAVTPTLIAGTLTPTVKANLENTTVKQGNGS